MTRQEKNALMAGYAAALADLSRMNHIDQPEISDALRGIATNLDDLRLCGADEDDLAELRKRLC